MRHAAMSSLAAVLVLSAPAARADAQADVEAAAHAYSIDVPKRLSLKAGEAGKLTVVVVPNPGNHVSPDAPVSLSATAAGGFELPQPKLARADARPTKAEGVEFSLPVFGKEKGQGELKATLSFYICVATLCARQKRELSVPVQVE